MSNAIVALRNYISNDEVKKRMSEMLGKRAGAYSNSIINVVRNSNALQKCTPESVMTAAMVAASMNLAIDPALGLAAIVPYGKSAQFILMYKGMTQLCIRSGKYERIYTTEVYKDELNFYNPITSEVSFTDMSTWKMRNEGKLEDVAGYYATFKLLSGFQHAEFMSHEQAMSHAKKFSKAYQYDLRDKKQTSVWSTDPVSMGKKTILKVILTKYGIMSIEMQDAIVAESVDDTFDGAKGRNDDKIKDEAGSEIIDVDATNATTEDVPEGDEDWRS